jgi:pSer/pThr/pTyr-binding forkhead associated (FHA) protein
MAAEVWLTFSDGSAHEFGDTLSIGRDARNDLVLESAAVSREHAILALRDARWYLEDRGSFNGTYLNGTRLVPGTPLPLHHADRISVGTETLIFSWPAQRQDPDTTEPLGEVATPGNTAQLSSFQRQVVQCLCSPWLAGASLETLPSNEQIAAELGTPGATGTVKAALRRIYAKADLSDEPAHAKRRALCRIARQNGWI